MSDFKADLIYGFHAVESAIKHDEANVLTIWCEASRKDKRLHELIETIKQTRIPLEFVDKKTLDKKSKGARHQGVIAQYKNIKPYTEKDLDQFLAKDQLLVLMLDSIQDPHNLGACLRTADACGVDFVVIPKDKAVGITPVVRKVASGAVENVPVVQVTNLARVMKQLQQAGVWLIGAAGETESSLFDTDLTGKIAIVMGAEEKGLRRLTRENCDLLVRIPMQGKVESLNVSVATAVCLYEAVRQRQINV